MVGGLVCQTVEKMWNRWFLKATSLQSTSRARRLEERKSYGPSICHHALEMRKGWYCWRERSAYHGCRLGAVTALLMRRSDQLDRNVHAWDGENHWKRWDCGLTADSGVAATLSMADGCALLLDEAGRRGKLQRGVRTCQGDAGPAYL
jgi:hypothetical protein